MKGIKYMLSFVFIQMILIFSDEWKANTEYYNEDLVEVSKATFYKDQFQMVSMDLSQKRIKVKYFAAMDPHNKRSVAQRFHSWKKGKKIIAVTSGTYMSSCIAPLAKPIGMCVDNGVVVNQYLEQKLGALVIVKPNGQIESIKWKDQPYTIQYRDYKKTLSLQKSLDKNTFIEWTQAVEATIFQTHLLVHQDQLNVSECTSKECLSKASRRFLVVGKNSDQVDTHHIIHLSQPYTLYDASSKVFRFLKEYKEMSEVSMMINLDTGCQDVLDIYRHDGTREHQIKGQFKTSDAVNLLVYYYE